MSPRWGFSLLGRWVQGLAPLATGLRPAGAEGGLGVRVGTGRLAEFAGVGCWILDSGCWMAWEC
jgi:hypothetical protein